VISGIFSAAALCAALPALAQSGLRVPERGEPGLDPSFARGWLAPDYDRFGFVHSTPYWWRESAGYTQGTRVNWSYAFSQRYSLGMALANGREVDQDRFSLFGRYSFTPDWSFSAEMSRDGTGLRPQDLRIGVQRRF